VNGFIEDAARGSALWGYAMGAAGLTIGVLAPVLGAIADAGLPRKPWIAGFSVLLVLCLCGLWLAAPGRTDLAPLMLLALGIADVSAELATVFNNAMMPSLVSPQRLGTLSGIGWATAYAGGLVSLVFVTGLIVADPTSGKTLLGLQPIIRLDPATHEDDRLIRPFSALWYLIFVLPLFLFTPDRPAKVQEAIAVKQGLSDLARAIKKLIRDHPPVALFLLARMLYADRLGAVFAFGGIYAATVFGWGATELGLFGVILSVPGTISAALGGMLDDRFGSKAVIVWALVLFLVSALGVLSVDKSHVLFVLPIEARLPGSAPFTSVGEQVYLAFAILIGVASHPIQSASRTLLARLSPPDKTTEFFGFFSFSGKISSFAAPLLIAVTTTATDSQRLGIGTSVFFLVGGLLLLQRVRAPR
jgi:MFS transporter, UMF1 family